MKSTLQKINPRDGDGVKNFPAEEETAIIRIYIHQKQLYMTHAQYHNAVIAVFKTTKQDT